MKKRTIRIYAKEGKLLWEAMRRMLCMGEKKSLNDSMLGLGYPSYYKSGVDAGLFVPSFTKDIARVCGWYRLTPLGQKIVKQLIRRKIFPKSCHEVHGGFYGEITVFI
jgi:hypothetical protein